MNDYPFLRFTGICAGLAITAVYVLGTAWAQPVPVPNPSFESGGETPEGWRLSGGEGGWAEEAVEGARAVYVRGVAGSQTSNCWYSEPIDFEPNWVYRLTFQAKREGGTGGTPISGPAFCNRDLHGVTLEWEPYTSYFVAPSSPMDSRLRLGQWEAEGTIAFDDVSLAPVVPVYRRRGDIVLGAGERIEGNGYFFSAPQDEESANHARPLAEHRCGFNKPRWTFGLDDTVTYRHQVGTRMQTAAEVEINISYYTAGNLVVEARRDDTTEWVSLGKADKEGGLHLKLPDTLFPAESVMVRLRGIPAADNAVGPVNLQVNGYTYQARLDQSPGDLLGETCFMTVTAADGKVQVLFDDLEGEGAGIPIPLSFRAANLTREPFHIEPTLTFSSGAARSETVRLSPVLLPPRSDEQAAPVPVNVVMPTLPEMGTGMCAMTLELGNDVQYRAETAFRVSVLEETRYGWTLPAASEEVGLWWASSGWKVSRTRPAPQARAAAMRIQAAQNECEAAQFVLRPARPLSGLRISAGPMRKDDGTILPPEAVEIARVGYVHITRPTDDLGAIAPWPDPLPPLNGPLNLAANENQPFWVCLHTAPDTPAGVYRGSIALTADRYQAEVPLEVEVFDFELPSRKSCVSAFGFNASLAFRYHNVSTDTDRRIVLDKYFSLLGAHHISVYDPACLDPIQYTWPQLPLWRGGVRDANPDNPGDVSLLLRDTSETAAVSALYDKAFPLSPEGIHITFRYKTETPGHRFLVTVLSHDAAGAWMSGRNKDIAIEGDGTWQQFDIVANGFPEEARQFKLRLWATLYSETGVHTGAVWLDDIQIADAASGTVLLREEFAALDAESMEACFTPEFDWTGWDAAMTCAFEKYHFNSFKMMAPGLGGGTFHDRYEPELLGYGETAPEYKAAFNAWYRGAEAHLREKGWLDEAFIYWFDEPEPDDYDFVMNGFRKLKETAPGLNRMLTEEVTPELIGGPNIWCPISFNYDHEKAQQRRAEGDIFWWYICTGPKAPYATLFIDHPGTELRVWLWQTWERGIDGILVWETNYWSSTAAYPDALQNPYEDAMSWTSGYSTPAGARLPWGNGDGRFVYPPLSAADGNPSGPVFDAPVGSMRLDMLRDGIEDYEYMVILSRLVEAHEKLHPEADVSAYRQLLEVPDAITASLTEFTWDPAPIEAHRESVARAIVHLKATQ